MIFVKLTGGPRAGERVHVDRELVFGRADCDVTLDDAEISRRHVVLRPAETYLQVEDLGSSNGTFVDGQRTSGAVNVAHGHVIQIGASQLVVEVSQASPQLPTVMAPKAASPAAPLTPEPAAQVPAAAVGPAPSGGLPNWLWIATELVEAVLIVIALVVLFYYAF